MLAPSWKTGSQHIAISSTSGCSMRGNEVSNSHSASRSVGSSIEEENWLFDTFLLLYLRPQKSWEKGLLYVGRGASSR